MHLAGEPKAVSQVFYRIDGRAQREEGTEVEPVLGLGRAVGHLVPLMSKQEQVDQRAKSGREERRDS